MGGGEARVMKRLIGILVLLGVLPTSLEAAGKAKVGEDGGGGGWPGEES